MSSERVPAGTAQVVRANRPGAYTVVAYAVLLLLTVLLALWGAFLVPLRVGRVAVPVGDLLALATVPLCVAGGRLLGRRAGAAVPLAVWTVVAFALSTQTKAGDLVITGSLRGVAFLALGLLGGALAVGSWPRPAPAAGPRGRDTGPGVRDERTGAGGGPAG